MTRAGLVILWMGMGCVASAQVITPGSISNDYLRILALRQDSVRLFDQRWESVRYGSPDGLLDDQWEFFHAGRQTEGVRWLTPRIAYTHNSAYARSYKNGPVWTGRGSTVELHGGVQYRKGILHATFQPAIHVSQNRAFRLPVNPFLPPPPDRSPFNTPYSYGIDDVVRPGEDPYIGIHPGQSEISLRFDRIKIGAGTQNWQIGPALLHPILMGDNAPGFPHLMMGTNRPLPIWIGDLQIQKVWGGLYESRHFDSKKSNDWRYFSALTLGLTSKYVPGLQIGFNRIFVSMDEDFRFPRHIVPQIGDWTIGYIDPDPYVPNDAFDQVASITGSWQFPQVGFEVWFEWAKNDFGGDFWGQIPESSRAFVLGFTKLFDLPDASVFAFSMEMTTTNQTLTILARAPGTWYAHTEVIQGYTNGGRILGSGLGFGSSGYVLNFRRYTDTSMQGYYLQWIRFNEDYFYANFRAPSWEITTNGSADYEVGMGFRGARRIAGRWVSGHLGLHWRHNMHFVQGELDLNVGTGIAIGL